MSDQLAFDDDDDIDDDFEPPSATAETYRDLSYAFDVFNARLFDNELPETLITMQRKRGARGYFGGNKFEHRRGNNIPLDEIALNPATFRDRTDRQIISTLVHEMAHLWQHHFGKPGRGRYHNRQWANKMVELGLTPSDTGEPGGKQTGDRVSHYIVENGPYDTIWKSLESTGFKIDWQDRAVPDPASVKKLKTRYICPSCDLRMSGKPDARVVCEDCSLRMEER